MPVQGGPEKTTYHPNKRRVLGALAEVRIFQAAIIDSDGKMYVVPIWKCGTDIWMASTIDGLFNEQSRQRAPKWIIKQLAELPAAQRFDWDGNSLAGNTKAPSTLTAPAIHPVSVENDDDDVPGFSQA